MKFVLLLTLTLIASAWFTVLGQDSQSDSEQELVEEQNTASQNENSADDQVETTRTAPSDESSSNSAEKKSEPVETSDVFDPSEDISEDYAVPFPTDI